MSGRQDQRIDTVLNAVKQAEPDPAMTGRLLAALRQAEIEGRNSATLFPRQNWASGCLPLLPWVAAAALLAAVGTLLLHKHGVGGFAAYRDGRPITTTLAPGSSLHPGVRGESLSQAPGNLSHTLTGVTVQPYRLLSVSQEHGARGPGSSSASTAAKKTEPNLPPPPLAPTEQERLLLRLARREPPQQLAQLSQPAQDAALQRDRDSVSEFFAPPPPLTQETSPDESSTGQQ